MWRVVAIGWLLTTTAAADELGDAVRQAVRVAEPSIVRLQIVGGEQSIEGAAVSSQITTGLVVSEGGEILTSQFALEGQPQAVLARDADGQNQSCQIVATDHIRRLTLLKAGSGRWVPVPTAIVEARIGQWTIAAGRFYSVDQSNVSVGILSAVKRIHGLALQTDAKVSPVNYGGPLLDLNGGVLGILVPLSPRGQGGVTSGVEWYDSGIGFAIPLADALLSATRLRAGDDLKPGRMGLSLGASSPFDADLKVQRIARGGPADKAGMKVDDRIVSVNGTIVKRASVLEEAVARSYAGESLQIEVERGGANTKLSLELVDELPVFERGYVGLMTMRREDDEEASGVPDIAAIAKMLREANGTPVVPEDAAVPTDAKSGKPPTLLVVSDSPAAKAGLPSVIELLKVNDQLIDSRRALRLALGEVIPGSRLQIAYRETGSESEKSVEVEVAAVPTSIPRMSDEVVSAIQPAADGSTDVQRREFTFEDQGKAIVLAPKIKEGVRPGIVVLLSAHDQSEADLLNQWQSWLVSRRLLVVIPKNPESSALTADDMPLMLASMQSAGSEFKADIERVVLVADRAQAELAWQISTSGPSPFHGIALTSGRVPMAQISSVSGVNVGVLLPESSGAAQESALMNQTVEALRRAGCQVFRSQPNDMLRSIADWSLFLRSL